MNDPNQRLGYGAGGTGRLRSHPFFQGVDWEGLMAVDDASHDALIPPAGGPPLAFVRSFVYDYSCTEYPVTMVA